MDASENRQPTGLDKAGRIALSFIVLAVVAVIASFFVKPKKSVPDRSDILEKAREAKAAKRILNQSETETIKEDGDKEKTDS